MKKIILLVFLIAGYLQAQSGFYNEYWGEVDKAINNVKGNRWRVNDAESVLHRKFRFMKETSSNGIVLVDVPEDVFGLTKAEIYMELWGGHPKTTNKKVSINGKISHDIPGYGTEEGNCTYAYPKIEIEPKHMVKGKNSLQFSCEKGKSFWGHYIIDNLSMRCFLKPDHVDIIESGLDSFKVQVVAPDMIENELTTIKLNVEEKYIHLIEKVEYFANYFGYDDNGNGLSNDWHGYTFKREYTNNVGKSESNPYSVMWNTEMIADQSKPIRFRAIISFKNGLKYLTEPSDGTILSRKEFTVSVFYANEIPSTFWSRDNKYKVAKVYLPIETEKVIKTELHVRVWDGGKGTIKEPFKLNGFPFKITSGKGIHDLVFTKSAVSKEKIKYGWNKYELISDTKHHGIEVLLPGPSLIIRSKK